jgi:hypothetical protein
MDFSLEYVEAEYSDLTSHTEVRWLNKGKVLMSHINLNDEVITFLSSKNEVVDSLSDYSLLTYLAFVADITQKLNTVEFL